ncbi:hypothetical protein OG936_30750 [Streptomyces sp. NBC_00846]|uniref:hypothetical protein n=1 Tax=Streptomyces sp. NBC_00846 TaxID=2975849 RepID=UPI003868836E|nr:hypothetical protein OG936_30750 [Streptomyces sp. NBC_00846]
MHTDRPPRRTVAVLAGLSCLFLPLLAHIPKASAASDAGSPSAATVAAGPGSVVTATMAGADPEARTVFDSMVKYLLAHPSVNNANLLAAGQDWMTDHFRAFKTATGDSTWDTVRTAHQNLITSQQSKYAANTGLLADFIVNTNTTPKPAAGEVLEGLNDWLDALWNKLAATSVDPQLYYGGSFQLQSMIVASGN